MTSPLEDLPFSVEPDPLAPTEPSLPQLPPLPGLAAQPQMPPVAPVMPTAPVAPAPVAAPVAPVAPAPVVAPVEPVAPVMPVAAPVEPVAPVMPVAAPVEPVAPVMPVEAAPAAPSVTGLDLAPEAAPLHRPPAPVAPVTPAGDGPALPAAASTPGVQAAAEESEEKILLDDLLLHMVESGGSDLHLTAGSPPVMRVRGDITPITGYSALTGKQILDAMYAIMEGAQKAVFEERLELDFAYEVPGEARFRVNVFKQQGHVGAVMRAIPWEILSLEALRLPPVIGELSKLERGLVLVTGPTGSGKSTTLASIIDQANRNRAAHIMTIEDPVEFIHQHRRSIVNQREVGPDTLSFQTALKHVLRQDPDIILVGELRDLETISVALTAAETGHLVFATLHTQSAAETITRIVDVFPADQQAQVLTQLASSLQAVVCQTLCKTADGNGRQAAVEIMLTTPNIRAMIRDKKLQQIPGALQSGASHGMQTLNQDLAKHALEGRITYDTGAEKCSELGDYEQLTGGREKVEAMARRSRAQRNSQLGTGTIATPPLRPTS